MSTIYLFNTSIAPTAGLTYHLTTIDRATAAAMVKQYGATSAIGHQATADAMTEILGIPVEVNRIAASMRHGDSAIVLKIRGRLPEGRILSRADLEEIGYDLLLMRAHDDDSSSQWVQMMVALGAQRIEMPGYVAPESTGVAIARDKDGLGLGVALVHSSELCLRPGLLYRDDVARAAGGLGLGVVAVDTWAGYKSEGLRIGATWVRGEVVP